MSKELDEKKKVDIFDDLLGEEDKDAEAKKEEHKGDKPVDGEDGEIKEEVTEESLQSIRDHLNAMAAKMQATGDIKMKSPEELQLELEDIDLGSFDMETGITLEQLKKGFKAVQESTIKNLIGLIDKRLGTVQQQTQAAMTGLLMSERFFAKNPDLEPYRSYVGMKWDKIVSDDQNINFSDLFKRLEKEVREDLRLKGGGNSNQDPALVKKPNSSARPADKKKPAIVAELDELKPGRR